MRGAIGQSGRGSLLPFVVVCARGKSFQTAMERDERINKEDLNDD